MDDIENDPRFAHTLQDPRFRQLNVKHKKVRIDSRFKNMLKEREFTAKYTVDKRGRPINTSAKENLERLYNYDSNESDDSDDESDDDGDDGTIDDSENEETSEDGDSHDSGKINEEKENQSEDETRESNSEVDSNVDEDEESDEDGMSDTDKFQFISLSLNHS